MTHFEKLSFLVEATFNFDLICSYCTLSSGRAGMGYWSNTGTPRFGLSLNLGFNGVKMNYWG